MFFLMCLDKYSNVLSGLMSPIASPDDILAHTSLSILYQKKGMVPEAEAEGNKARVLGWKQQLKKGSG